MFGARKKLLLSLVLCVAVFAGGLLAFVIIPAQLGKFRGADAMVAGTSTASVSGNGGSAVMVGDYLYFASGYKSKYDIEYKENEYNNIRGEYDGGIWRIRLPEGKPEYDNEYLWNYLRDNHADFPGWQEYRRQLENGTCEIKEYNDAFNKSVVGGGVNRLELVVPKIAAWQNTAIWIYGDTLIYTSPNNQKDRHGDLQSSKIDFFRCDLRGLSHQKIYTTKSDEVNVDDFTVAWGGAPYLLVKDDKTLVRVDMKGKVSTVSTEIATVHFPIITGYYETYFTKTIGGDLDSSFSGMMSYVYFTENKTDGDKLHGNKIFSYHFGANSTKEVLHNDNNHTILAFGNGYMVLKTSYYSGGADKIMVTNDVTLASREQNTSFALQGVEKEVYVSQERTNTFRFITHDGTYFRVYNPFERNSEGGYASISIKTNTTFGRVISMTTNTIIYENNSGNEANISTIHYFDGVEVGSITIQKHADARISAFRMINGLTFGMNIFFMQPFKTEGEDPEEMIAGCVVDVETGLENVLARLDIDKYVALPKKSS